MNPHQLYPYRGDDSVFRHNPFDRMKVSSWDVYNKRVMLRHVIQMKIGMGIGEGGLGRMSTVISSVVCKVTRMCVWGGGGWREGVPCGT